MHGKLEDIERKGHELIAAMWSKLTRGWSDYEDDSE